MIDVTYAQAAGGEGGGPLVFLLQFLPFILVFVIFYFLLIRPQSKRQKAVQEMIKNRNRTLSPVWKAGFNGILDAYLGSEPTNFSYAGESFTPESFGSTTELSPVDYVAIGSFTHHPFYEDVVLEIPDNWLWSSIENVPLDEMIELLDHALEGRVLLNAPRSVRLGASAAAHARLDRSVDQREKLPFQTLFSQNLQS